MNTQTLIFILLVGLFVFVLGAIALHRRSISELDSGSSVGTKKTTRTKSK